MSEAESPTTDPTLIARPSAAVARMQMYLIGGSTGALGFAMLFLDWRLMFVSWAVGGLLCAALSLAADARERHAQPFLAVDRDDSPLWHRSDDARSLGGDRGIAFPEQSLRTARSLFRHHNRRSGGLQQAFRSGGSRTRAFVMDRDEIHIPIQEIDATRDDIRKIVAHYRPHLTPP